MGLMGGFGWRIIWGKERRGGEGKGRMGWEVAMQEGGVDS